MKKIRYVRLKAALIVAVAASGAFVSTAEPAAAAGSFTWAADITCCIDSRNWAQGGGSTTITAFGACANHNMERYGYAIYLYRGTSRVGSWTQIRCGANRQKTFPGLTSGTYHFRLEKPNDSVLVHFSGDVRYP